MFYSLFWGNFFSLLSAVCLAISVMKKNKNALIKWQIYDTFFCILSAIALGSYPALSTQIVCIVRNTMAYRNELTKQRTLCLACLCMIIGSYVNNLGLVGYFPPLATFLYSIMIYKTANEQQMRYALIFNLMLWLFHDLYIKAYPGAMMDIVISLWTAFFALKYLYGYRNMTKVTK